MIILLVFILGAVIGALATWDLTKRYRKDLGLEEDPLDPMPLYDKGKIAKAVSDIIWMARRYVDKRQTYAVGMFNDAYDLLRSELGDVVEFRDGIASEFENYPYATDGGGKIFNRDLKERRYYEGKAKKSSNKSKVKIHN